MSELRDWAGLPDGLLHSIVELLCSSHDLLAFAATCHPWRSAFSSYPSKSTLYSSFPPLLLDPNVSFCSPSHFPNVSRNTSVPIRPCYTIDLASQDTLPSSQIPLFSIYYEKNIPDKFIGASFGHMIFSSNKTCFLFDVFTGFVVSPPPLPVDEDTENYLFVATLTAPLASPNSHLIVSSEFSNFYWCVGGNSWLELSRNSTFTQFVVFKGVVYGMCSDRNLFMVHLTPHIHLQEIPVSWCGRNSMTKWHLDDAWLVVCGDMLLMVGCQSCFLKTAFEAYHLDTSTEPAKWVKVERLEKWAIFKSTDPSVQQLACMNPERWGGRSNCVYCYDSVSGRLVALELGKPLPEDDATRSKVSIFGNASGIVQPIWIAPSMLS